MPLLDFLFGSPQKFEQVPRFSPQQQQAFSSILSQALSGLQPGSFGQGFEPIAQQARSQFSERIVPSLAERFTALDGQRSSAFAQSLGQAGAGLERDLAGQQAQFGLQQQGLSQNLLGMGLTPQFETSFMPRQAGFLESLLSSGSQGLGSLLPLLLMGSGGGLSGLLSGLRR